MCSRLILAMDLWFTLVYSVSFRQFQKAGNCTNQTKTELHPENDAITPSKLQNKCFLKNSQFHPNGYRIKLTELYNLTFRPITLHNYTATNYTLTNYTPLHYTVTN